MGPSVATMNGNLASSTSSSAPPVGPTTNPQRHGHAVSHFHHNQHSSPSPKLMQRLHHQPSNIGEWQLFTVLQRANLLQYYDTFISQGGDDINQLLEAGEEEFLEIMSLVGMASKPLHEYSMNPAAFQLLAIQKSGVLPHSASGNSAASGSFAPAHYSSLAANPLLAVSAGVVPPTSIVTSSVCHRPTSAHSSTATALASLLHPVASGSAMAPTAPNPMMFGGPTAAGSVTSDSPGATSVHSSNSSNIWPSPRADAYDLGISDHNGANGLTSTLTEAQIQRLAQCAAEVLRQVPDTEHKSVQNRKRISRELMAVMELPVESPFRIDEFRRFSAIYGRFDARRKADKPLSLHEVLVNEAAAQICLHRPALLARRDELFPLARHVVKEAGFNYVKSAGRPNRPDQEEVLLEGNVTVHKRTTSITAGGSADDGDGVGSPAPSTSSASQASPGASALTISLSPPSDCRSEAAQSSSSSLPSGVHKRQKRRLEDIGMELQRVSAEQEACKRRVSEAQEMADVIRIHRELQRLTQRQMDLSDEEASLKVTEDYTNGAKSMKGNDATKCSTFTGSTPEHPNKVTTVLQDDLTAEIRPDSGLI